MSQLKAIVDPLLSGVSTAYIPQGFLADQILPLIKAKTSTGKLAKYGKSHIRLELNFKSGRGEYRRVEPISRSTDSFSIKGHGLEGMVTKEDYKNVQDPFDAEKDETLGTTLLIQTEKEYLMAASLTSTSLITQNTTLSGTAQYNDYANSDPISDANTARETILNACGQMPNVVVMDILVWNRLRFHPGILDALGFKWDRPGGLNAQELAMALGVDKILLAGARYNSAKEGQADALSAVWGKDILFAVLPDKAVPYQISLGYLVGFEGEQARKVYKYPINNPPESTGILVEDNYDIVLTNANAGYLIKSAIA